MSEYTFELMKITLPIVVTAIVARLQRKQDLKDIESGKKKTTDFHHFTK